MERRVGDEHIASPADNAQPGALCIRTAHGVDDLVARFWADELIDGAADANRGQVGEGGSRFER